MVSGVGRRMGVLNGRGGRRRGRDSFGVNVGHFIVTNVLILSREGWRRGSSQITLAFLVLFRPRYGLRVLR